MDREIVLLSYTTFVMLLQSDFPGGRLLRCELGGRTDPDDTCFFDTLFISEGKMLYFVQTSFGSYLARYAPQTE